MAYIDGFVAAVEVAKKEAYITHAQEAWAIMQEYGAIAVAECWGDDVPDGELTSFPLAVKAEEGEVVVFSWVTWPDKTARDEGWAKLMTDDRMNAASMPFDGKRMIYGGFELVWEASAAAAAAE
ncbi:MAG: DUF1428 domain-containing protein [Pseudomonadota bacterium]